MRSRDSGEPMHSASRAICIVALLRLVVIKAHDARVVLKNESGDREQMQMHILFVRVAHSTRSCQAVPRREPGHLVLGFLW